MKESIVISGMLRVLAYILAMVGPSAAIPRAYNQILFPGDIIEGWHRAGENYYKFEKRIIIGHDHPYNRYSSMKLFWPEDKSSYDTKGRITFFKCTNQTPTNAKTLMYLIRGGTGSQELVVDIMYAPLQFMLMNTMIVTCDIYTKESDIAKYLEPLWNLADIMKTGVQISPIVTKTEVTIPTRYATNSIGRIRSEKTTTQMKFAERVTERTKVSSTIQETTKLKNNGKKLFEVGTSPRTVAAKLESDNTSEGTNRTTAHGEETNRKSDNELLLKQEMVEEINKTTLFTDGLSLKTNSKDSQDKELTETNSNNSKLTGKKKTIEVTSPKTVETSSQESVTRPMIDNSTLSKVSGRGKNLITNKIVAYMNRKGAKRTGKNSGDKRTSTINFGRGKTSPGTDWTNLEVTSPGTIEVTSQKSLTSQKTEKFYLNVEVKNPKSIENAIAMLCGNESINANTSNVRDNETGPNTSSEDSQDERIQKINLSGERFSQRTGKTTSEIQSPEISKSSSEKSVTLSIMDELISSFEEISSKRKEADEIRHGETGPRTDKPNLDGKGTRAKTSSLVLQDLEGKSLKTEETIKEPIASSIYNLTLKFTPIGLKKKIGLAKITYR